MYVKLQTIVASKLILDWSPEQISGLISLRARTAWMSYSTMAQLGAASFESSNRQSPLRKNRQFLASKLIFQVANCCYFASFATPSRASPIRQTDFHSSRNNAPRLV